MLENTPAWQVTRSASLITLRGSLSSTVCYDIPKLQKLETILKKWSTALRWRPGSDVCAPLSLTSDLPPSPLPSQTYLEIFIYCLGFFIIIILTATAVICRLCCAPKKSDFGSQLAVQKLAKSIPLRRQVTCPSLSLFPFCLLSWPPCCSKCESQLWLVHTAS